MIALGLTSPPPPRAPLSPSTELWIGAGLLFAGAVVTGKLVIDGLLADAADAKARREFIGPVWEPKAEPKPQHVQVLDAVRFALSCASFYSLLVNTPELVSAFQALQKNLQEIAK